MKKSSLLAFLISYFPAFALDIKVSDQYPTLLELSGTIEKISFGNGDQEYVSKEEGRFLEVKAKYPGTSKTTITVFYLSNEGKKNEKVDVFYGTVSYDAGIQPMYNLTNHKVQEIEEAEKWDTDEPLTESLTEAIEYVTQEQPNIKRFHQTKQKVSCFLSNAISTGEEVVLKFVLKNNSPYNYKVGGVYFVGNNKDKTAIPIKLKPKRMVVAPGEIVPMIFVIKHKVEKSGIVVRFEEKKGRRDLNLTLPNRLLLSIPCFVKESKEV
ncbi:MAG: hypothetical protein NMK33_06240 (plasmid) [Candidatus Cardinium sp.]|uniref:hypothetical protein n=1 Tax=Cardinium endosymbiont of Dermatophagoides farinae TaxID=2597823 RepID=UPI001182E324|nr:hypothetical protein [Cardinium endosymbiont of Dermatophagoides farinae]TSJ80104.1 hypothetical protein FPG78_06480 [Cardinium endosymbiont of Dermatophagoides farinae]UWW97522.1 MAG: hypothetical protein NMK33_06240 [Candidatus Cardinium sp.]